MKKFIYLLLLLPMCGVAQEQLQNESAIFKAIEAKFKFDRRQVYWALYTERGLKEDTIHKLVVFPLKKRSRDKMLYDAYVVLYNLQKQMIDNYYIGEGEWEDSDRGRLQGWKWLLRRHCWGRKRLPIEVRVFSRMLIEISLWARRCSPILLVKGRSCKKF